MIETQRHTPGTETLGQISNAELEAEYRARGFDDLARLEQGFYLLGLADGTLDETNGNWERFLGFKRQAGEIPIQDIRAAWTAWNNLGRRDGETDEELWERTVAATGGNVITATIVGEQFFNLRLTETDARRLRLLLSTTNPEEVQSNTRLFHAYEFSTTALEEFQERTKRILDERLGEIEDNDRQLSLDARPAPRGRAR